MNVDFTDFRVILAFPTFKTLLIFAQTALKASGDLQKKLAEAKPIEAKIIEESSSATIAAKTVAALAVKGSSKIIAKIVNVEIWLPEDVITIALSNRLKIQKQH